MVASHPTPSTISVLLCLSFKVAQPVCDSSSIQVNTSDVVGGTVPLGDIDTWAKQEAFCVGLGKRLCTLEELCADRPLFYAGPPLLDGTIQPCFDVPATVADIPAFVAYNGTGSFSDNCESPLLSTDTPGCPGDTWVQIGTFVGDLLGVNATCNTKCELLPLYEGRKCPGRVFFLFERFFLKMVVCCDP